MPTGPRLALVPGLRVVDRGREHLQVGLDPSRSVLLRRTPALLRVLATLRHGGVVAPGDEEAVRALRAHGLVLDPARLLEGPAAAMAAGDVAASALTDPDVLVPTLERRGRTRVGVLLPGTPHPALDPRPLLAAAGLPVIVGSSTGAVPGQQACDLTLVLALGETRRALTDDLVTAAMPHLVVRLMDGVGLVGPFWSPGLTACLRCLDLHAEAEDPGHELRVERYALACADPRSDGCPEPVDSALAALVVAWAVRDVVSHVDGRRPSTWSTQVRLEPDLAGVGATASPRHPDCACAWVDQPQGRSDRG